jgi:hypothetical protein
MNTNGNPRVAFADRAERDMYEMMGKMRARMRAEKTPRGLSQRG